MHVLVLFLHYPLLSWTRFKTHLCRKPLSLLRCMCLSSSHIASLALPNSATHLSRENNGRYSAQRSGEDDKLLVTSVAASAFSFVCAAPLQSWAT